MSTTILPFESPSATPLAPNRTAFTCGVSGTIMMTTSDCSATSLPDLQTTSPAATSSCEMGPTSQRNSRCPAVWRCLAIGRPIVPKPIKPTSIISIFLFCVRLCVGCLYRIPAEAFSGGGLRLVFATNPAAISDPVETSKQEGIIDLSRARFVATGIVGQLNMRDTIEMFLQRSRDVALHHLHVVDVILNEQIVGPDIGNDLKSPRCPVQEEARDIERVDRLDQEANAFPGQGGRGEPQVLQQHLIQLEQIGIRRRDTDETIHLMAIECRRIIDGAQDAVEIHPPDPGKWRSHARRLPNRPPGDCA